MRWILSIVIGNPIAMVYLLPQPGNMICKPFCHTHVLHILHTYLAFPILQMETHSPFNHLSLRCGSTCIHEKSLPKPFVWGACYTQSWYFFSELGSTLKPSVKQHAKFTLWMHLIYKHNLNCYPGGRQSFNCCCNNKHPTCNILW